MVGRPGPGPMSGGPCRAWNFKNLSSGPWAGPCFMLYLCIFDSFRVKKQRKGAGLEPVRARNKNSWPWQTRGPRSGQWAGLGLERARAGAAHAHLYFQLILRDFQCSCIFIDFFNCLDFFSHTFFDLQYIRFSRCMNLCFWFGEIPESLD